MATGDQGDFAARLYAVLPSRWFPALSAAPLLSGLLNGLGASWAAVYAQIAFTRLQARVASATGSWLDGISQDFNAGQLPRLANEADPAFSARIRSNFFAPRATRAGIIASLEVLGCAAPVVFNPANSGDTGGYGVACGYGAAGGWGDLDIPFSFFVTVTRPVGGGIPLLNGYGDGSGGYGRGSAAYGDTSMIVGEITDTAIQQAVAAATADGVTAWMRITT